MSNVILPEELMMTDRQLEVVEDLSSLTSHSVEISEAEDGAVWVHLSFPGLWIKVSPGGARILTETDRQRSLKTTCPSRDTLLGFPVVYKDLGPDPVCVIGPLKPEDKV
jgi:hypothetical protein